MDKEFLANEASRLSKDPVFIEALQRIREKALEALVTVPVDNTAEILRHQATVTVCDGIRTEVESMILSREDKRPIRAV